MDSGDAELSAKPRAQGNLVASYWNMLEGHRRGAVIAVVDAIVSGLLETAGVLAVVPLIEARQQISAVGIQVHGSELRYWAVVAFIVFALTAAGMRLLGERAIIRVIAGFERSRRQEITQAALGMDWAAFLRLHLGDVNTSLLFTISQVALGVQIFVRSMGMLGVVVVFVAVAVGISWQLSVFTFALAAIAVVAYLLGAKPTRRHTTALADAASDLGREADLLFGNLKLFRSLGDRKSSQARMDGIYHRYESAFTRSQYTLPRTRSILESTGIIGIAVVLLAAVIRSHGASLSPSSIAFLVLFLRLAPRFVSAQENLQASRNYRRWCDTWWETLGAMEDAPMLPTGSAPPHFDDALQADHVGFTYPGTIRPVLHDANWTLGRREAIAFVGDSGSGKTTMLDMVTGLLQPTEGLLTLDGVDLRTIDVELWQSHLGLVMQEPPVLAGTVLDNVVWTEPDRDEARVWEALSKAHAMEFVDRMPGGVHATLGQRGATLSGGERQRLALARALYRRPWLLILDEPTSALDAESEHEVLRALADVKSTCAMIIVAHGLNPLRLADRIYVLSGGTMVEHGTWAQLTERTNGVFAEMIRRHALT
jgi:ABC-type multidrug transport system fused ATPase/permease subunit